MPYLHKLDYIMPLVSPKKSSKADWQLLIDKVANNLPHQKAEFMNKVRRLTAIKVVLFVILIHQMLALKLPKWMIKNIDKRRRGLLWAKKEVANGGKCLLAWDKVTRPPSYGLVLRIRWVCLEKMMFLDLGLGCHYPF